MFITIIMMSMLCFHLYSMDRDYHRIDQTNKITHIEPSVCSDPLSQMRCGEVICGATTIGSVVGMLTGTGIVLHSAYNPLYWLAVVIGCCTGCACGTCYVCIRNGQDACCKELMEFAVAQNDQ
jgi:transposase InsO family protein